MKITNCINLLMQMDAQDVLGPPLRSASPWTVHASLAGYPCNQARAPHKQSSHPGTHHTEIIHVTVEKGMGRDGQKKTKTK